MIEPISGNVSYGLRVMPGYFDQTLAMIDSNKTILEEFRNHLPSLTEQESRSALGSFLFKGDDVYKEINVLSGGEKVRLQLCCILYNKPNFLILDEPTNHMDIVGKEHLENILSEYTGTIIFVSHDRYFVKKIANQLLVFDDDGVNFYPYGYEEYIQKMDSKEEKKEVKKEEKKIPVPNEVPNKKVNTYDARKNLNKLENEIIKLETKIKEYNNELFKSDVFNDYNKSSSINSKIEELSKELEEKNALWEELIEELT